MISYDYFYSKNLNFAMKKFLTKKILIEAAIFLVIGVVVFGIVSARKSGNSNSDLVIEQVQKHDLKQTVLATGQAVSETDLDLSFKVGGVKKRMIVVKKELTKILMILAPYPLTHQ